MSDTSPATPSRRCPVRNPVFLLAILLAVTTTGWVVTALNRDRSAAPPAPESPHAAEPLSGSTGTEPRPDGEMVTVLVAAKDLPVGTTFKNGDLSKLVGRKKASVDHLLPQIVRDEAVLVGKRLSRPVRKDETFDLGFLTGEFLSVPPGMHSTSLKMPSSDRIGNYIVTGSRVNILAAVKRGGQFDVFMLVEDVLVLAVETDCEAVELQNGTLRWDYSDVSKLTLAVDETQALLLTLAEQHRCHLQPLRHLPNKPLTLTKDDHKRRVKFFENLADEGKPEVAPAPRPKRATVYLPDGTDMMSLSFPGEAPAGGFVVPGSRVDVIATLKRGNKVEAFPLLDGVLVVAVDTVLVYRRDGGPSDTSLSFAVTREQALLVALAKQAGCKMEVLLRAPGKPETTTEAEYWRRAKVFQELIEEGKVPVAPTPRAKGE